MNELFIDAYDRTLHPVNVGGVAGGDKVAISLSFCSHTRYDSLSFSL